MRLAATALLLITAVLNFPGLTRSDADEIQLMVSNAPVVQAAAEAKEEEGLVVWEWLRTLSYAGRVDDAFAATSKIKGEMSEGEGLAAIADGLGIAGRIDEAMAMIRKIKLPGQPSALYLGVIILASAGRTDEALTEARETANADERSQALQSVSIGLARGGKVNDAIAVSKLIADPHSLSEALSSIAVQAAKFGKLDEAMELTSRLKNDPVAIQAIAEALAGAGRADLALKAAQQIADENSRERSFFDVVQALVRIGKTDEAIPVLRKINGDYLSSISLSAVVQGLIKQGEIDEANKPLKECLDRANRIKDVHSRSKALSIISIDLAEAGWTARALEVARPLTDDNDQAWAFEAIAIALVKQSKFDEALALARSIGKFFGNRSHALAAVAEGLARAGKTDQALAIAGARTPDSAADQAALVEGLAKAGKVDEAMKAAREIVDKDYRSIAYSGIAALLAQAHSYRQARLASDLCPSPLRRLSACVLILREYAIQQNPQLRTRLDAEERYR